LLYPSSGIPILDTSVNTPPEQFTWQDLIMLKFDLPVQWHAGASYLMNQRTAALMLTMSDALGRPLMIPSPTAGGGFMINGSPVVLASQMPDVAAGNTAVAFGDWRKCYTLVRRQGTTMIPDPYTAGFCTLFKFSTRIGGSVTCPNAARLLRIR
jgi:HK97 family phage major capsid protein